MTTERSVGSVRRRVIAVAIGLAAAFASGASVSEAARGDDERGGAAPLESLVFSFKLDQALTRGLYMGDRWVSPRVFSSTNQPGESATVLASVHGLDGAAARVAVDATWTPSDPSMVTVTPGVGGDVKITVRGAGESQLRVSAGGISKELTLRSVQKNDGTRVEIAQPAAAPVVPTRGPRVRDSPQRRTEAGAAGDSALREERARASYAAGAKMGTTLVESGVDLDADLVARGVRDALTGAKNPLTGDEMKAALAVLRTGFETNRIEARRRLAEKNKEEGEAFLAENRTKEGVVTLESGLQYRVLRSGEGSTPTARDRVVCHYRGSLVDGTEFDSSFRRGKPVAIRLTRLIRGWSQALQLMPVGSKWQLFIPPNLAYGERGGRKNGIGPNATLVFEVELLSIQEDLRQAAKQDVANASADGPPGP